MNILNSPRRVLIIPILVALALTPLVFSSHTWQSFATPKFFLFRITVWVMLLIYLLSKKKKLLPSTPLLLPFLFLLLGEVISAFVAVNMAETLNFRFMPNLFALFFFYIVTTAVMPSPKQIKAATVLIVLTGSIVSIYGLMQVYRLDPFHFYEKDGLVLPVSTLGNCTFAGMYLIIAIPLAFALFFYCRNPLAKMSILAAVFIMFSHLYFMDDQKSWLAVGFGLLGILFIFAKYGIKSLAAFSHDLHADSGGKSAPTTLTFQRSYFSILLIMILLFLAIYLGFLDLDRTDAFIKRELFLSEVWRSSLSMIEANPLLGVGDGNFKVVHPMFTSALENQALGQEVLARMPHNDYLWICLSKGMVGIVAFIWMVLVMIKCAHRILKHTCKDTSTSSPSFDSSPAVSESQELYLWFTVGAAAAFISILIYSYFDNVFLQPASVVTACFLAAVVNSIYNSCVRPGNIRAQSAVNWCDRPGSQSVRCIVVIVPWLIATPFLCFQYIGERYMRSGMTNKAYAYNYRMNDSRANADRYVERMFGDFEKAARYYPFEMEQYYILARYCIDLGLYEKGIELLKKNLYMNPNYKWAHNNLGVCYDKNGDAESARRHYLRALTIDPNTIFAVYNLAHGYYRDDRFAEALDYFDAALKIDPTRTSCLKYMGQCHYRCGEYEKAFDSVESYYESLIPESYKVESEKPYRLLDFYEKLSPSMQKTMDEIIVLMKNCSTHMDDNEKSRRFRQYYDNPSSQE